MDDIKLIRLIELHSELYDDIFKMPLSFQNAWDNIAKEMNETRIDCQRRWLILFTRYNDERKKLNDLGLDSSYATWPLYKEMGFLKNIEYPKIKMKNMKIKSTLNGKNSVSSTSMQKVEKERDNPVTVLLTNMKKPSKKYSRSTYSEMKSDSKDIFEETEDNNGWSVLKDMSFMSNLHPRRSMKNRNPQITRSQSAASITSTCSFNHPQDTFKQKDEKDVQVSLSFTKARNSFNSQIRSEISDPGISANNIPDRKERDTQRTTMLPHYNQMLFFCKEKMNQIETMGSCVPNSINKRSIQRQIDTRQSGSFADSCFGQMVSSELNQITNVEKKREIKKQIIKLLFDCD